MLTSSDYDAAFRACLKLAVTGARDAARYRAMALRGLKQAECMRGHGITGYPSPAALGGGLHSPDAVTIGLDTHTLQFQAAGQACGHGTAVAAGVVVAGRAGAAVSGGAVLKAASAGAARRLVPTVVMFVVLTAATTAALVGLALATYPARAFQAVSARYHIADLAVTIDATKVTSAQLARTRHLPGVTRAVGYPATTVSITIPATPGYRGGAPVSGPLTLVGRASRSGPIDHITQKSGRWPARPGEIDQNDLSGTRGSVGQLTTITVTNVRGQPKLAIVGWGSLPAQDDTQNAWAVPGEITALEQAGAPRQEQMLYTFRHAATAAQVRADLGELRAALPAGAITGYAIALGSASLSVMGHGIHASSAIPYALMALLLAAVIVAAVAAAAVTAGYRRIGVLKSIGFTPAQIAATYLIQLGIPALAGSLAGTVLGHLWALPLLQGRSLFKVAVTVPAWIDIAVPAGMLVLTGLAALVPAVRAGRLRTVQVITAGQAPRAGRGHAAHRLAGRLPLPRPVTAGLAAPFSRPARSAATLATITIGLTAAVLAVGLRRPDHQDRADHRRRLYRPRRSSRQLTWLVVVLAAHRRVQHAADAGPGTSPRPRDTQGARDDTPAGHRHGHVLGRRPAPSSPRPSPCPPAPPWNRWSPGPSSAPGRPSGKHRPPPASARPAQPRDIPRRASHPAPLPAEPCGIPVTAKS